LASANDLDGIIRLARDYVETIDARDISLDLARKAVSIYRSAGDIAAELDRASLMALGAVLTARRSQAALDDVFAVMRADPDLSNWAYDNARRLGFLYAYRRP
jgi:hypothetical protein